MGLFRGYLYESKRYALPRLSLSLFHIPLSLSLRRPVLPEAFRDPRRGRGGRAAPCWQEVDAKSCRAATGPEPWPVRYSC